MTKQVVEKDQKSKNYKEEMQVTIKADIIEDYDKLHILFYFSIYDTNPINILITVTDNITQTTRIK